VLESTWTRSAPLRAALFQLPDVALSGISTSNCLSGRSTFSSTLSTVQHQLNSLLRTLDGHRRGGICLR